MGDEILLLKRAAQCYDDLTGFLVVDLGKKVDVSRWPGPTDSIHGRYADRTHGGRYIWSHRRAHESVRNSAYSSSDSKGSSSANSFTEEIGRTSWWRTSSADVVAQRRQERPKIGGPVRRRSVYLAQVELGVGVHDQIAEPGGAT